MNRVTMIGNLASDPELTKTRGDISVCKFRLAVTRRRANADGSREADFFTVVCWRTLAEICAKWLRKGRKCAVEGSLQTRSWTGDDGQKRFAVDIVAEEVEFLTPRGDDMQEPPGQGAEIGGAEGFTEVPEDDDLPF